MAALRGEGNAPVYCPGTTGARCTASLLRAGVRAANGRLHKSTVSTRLFTKAEVITTREVDRKQT